ncbi:Serine/threonine-protein kinase Nek10, partial [Tupaia chinensis]
GPDEEAVVDLGKTSSTVNTKFEKEELESHRAVYIGVHVPFSKESRRRHKHRGHKHHHRRRKDKESDKEDGRESPSYDTPSQRVQFILGTEDDDEEHIPHHLFTEMDELCYRDGEEYEWKETARWLKFEEDVEDGGDRWSKPYVATLSLHSLFELRSCILNGTVMLDMRASTLDEIADMVLDNMIASGQLDESIRENVREALLKRHHHQNEKRFASRIPLVRSFADIGKKHSDPHLLERNGILASPQSAPGNLDNSKSGEMKGNGSGGSRENSTVDFSKVDMNFMRKIPTGAEASNVLVGEVDFLERPIIAFVRLAPAVLLSGLTEVPVPTRCVCVEPPNPSNETLQLWKKENKTAHTISWGNLTVSVRSTISDFAVFLTIVIMVTVDYLVGVPSPKLHVPEKFEPTDPNRGWLISPLGDNPWWTLLIAAIPALLCTILIFMDQQITAVIINRKEHKLKKGAGYHLDLLMVGVMLGVCSVMGLPWFVAATVLSISHVNSLKVESECSAPGEQPKFLGIREQRVTGLMIFILMGLSVFMTSVLKFFDRIKLFGMPAKHQPDLIYLRYVPLWKVHIFTVIQLTCLVLLWVIKASAAAVVFPMMVLALVFIRKLMDLCFTKRELSWLDDLMPESKKKKEDDKKKKEKEEAERMLQDDDDTVHLPFEGGSLLQIPVKALKYSVDPSVVNISDEMAKTAQWKALSMDSENAKVTRSNTSVDPSVVNISDEMAKTAQWKALSMDSENAKVTRSNTREWVHRAPSIHFLRVLICLRLLMRDPCYQEILHGLGGIENLAQYMEIVANEYLGYGDEQHGVDKLVNMTYIFQKLAAVKDQREWVTTSGAHKTLVNLLSARDTNVLLGSLLALTSLAERLTAELLRLLCAEPQVKEQVKLYEGIPVLLSLLHSDHLKLLWSVVWILVQVCEDPETSVEIRIWGGIKQLLHILRGDRNFVSDRSSIGSLSSANAAGRIQQLHLSEDLSPREIQENIFSLQAACCAALTELVLNDTNAHQVVQCYAFRALRFLFSMERNRPLFKRLFPTDLFEIFIDIGHYVRDISAYEELVSKLNSLVEDELKQIAENIESINQNKAPSKYIGNYAILDHLGSGAFGCVYKVRKRSGQNLLAMKEVNLHNPAFGKDKKDRDSSVKNIVSELTIIKEQLCLALRYLHKEKRIVHRDLTPNNIMLGDKDKVTVTDFGLAKQKQENSKLTSVVGTILYSCPEVLKSEPYGEKADVWAAGCILYQMATLSPPFYSTNMLSLATKIVEAVYEPVPEGIYSEKVTDTISRCLTPDAEARPDIVEVSSMLSDVMMKYLDNLSTSQLALEKKLERERRRTQRYFMEANRNAVTCHHELALLAHETFEKASLSSSSSGAASLKSELSESAELAPEGFQAPGGKDEDRACEEILSDDNFNLENIEKDIYSELDDELDISDNSSSSSSSPLKDSTFTLLPLDLLLKVPPLALRVPVKELEAELVTGWRSHSLPAVILRNLKDHASAGIAVSQRKVRQISDPIQQILIQLHKIIYITQLSQGSPEPIEPNFFTADYHSLCHSSGENSLSPNDPTGLPTSLDLEEGLTYEQMQTVIEEVLEESGYYNFISNSVTIITTKHYK